MGLQRVLNHLHALQDRIPMRFWGGDERENAVATSACGYRAKGRPCQHAEDQVVRVDRGGNVVSGLKPIPTNYRHGGDRLTELLADVNRQKSTLHRGAARLFHERYWIRVVETYRDSKGRQQVRIRQRTDAEVMALLSIRNESDYWRAHNMNLAAMEIRLIDWFERDEDGRSAADEFTDEHEAVAA